MKSSRVVKVMLSSYPSSTKPKHQQTLSSSNLARSHAWSIRGHWFEETTLFRRRRGSRLAESQSWLVSATSKMKTGSWRISRKRHCLGRAHLARCSSRNSKVIKVVNSTPSRLSGKMCFSISSRCKIQGWKKTFCSAATIRSCAAWTTCFSRKRDFTSSCPSSKEVSCIRSSRPTSAYLSLSSSFTRCRFAWPLATCTQKASCTGT